MDAFQAAEEANGMEKGCEPIWQLEQDEQDRLDGNSHEDDFRGEGSDSSITKLAIKTYAEGNVLISLQALEETYSRDRERQ